MTDPLEELEAALGTPIRDRRTRRGGDVNDTCIIQTGDGRRLFVKTHRAPPAEMFAREAEGLLWLREAGALRVPEVVCVGARFLAMEAIEAGPRARDHDEHLGRGLAALHRAGAPSFGGPRANYLAVLPQDNTPCDVWSDFYGTRRLAPLLRRASDAGHVSAATGRAFERLLARLGERCGPPEPPARLHGDLWGGNAIVDEGGAPVLVDPAVYGGHREVDLAMMRLFGGFGARVFAAYEEAHPLAPGAPGRVPLYQLYPLLAHVCLFGRSYVASLEEALGRLA